MPTPVGTARQCLTEESARALDDAVAVARRRCHSQTTSLHAVSALLALPSSVLREACSQARSGACSSRLQFRALDLSVGVSLDRLPTTRSQNDGDMDGPPVSNSLMAAIRRSQANQRRHPESFYLYQQSASVLKVELKHFVLSILDDPIVSRVFGEAGFRSCDIKMAILHPPASPGRKTLSRSPMFLCNLPGYDANTWPFRCGFGSTSPDDNSDDYFKVIMSVLGRNGENGRRCNPLLVGLRSVDAVNRFVRDVSNSDRRNTRVGELVGLRVITLDEKDLAGGSLRPKIEEICKILEIYTGPGLVLNYGELKESVVRNMLDNWISCLFSELHQLIEKYGEKMWLIGAVTTYDTFSALTNRFPDVEKSLNLHILPVASPSNSSSMRNFVPLGGFFPAKDEVRPLSNYEGLVQRRYHEKSWRNEEQASNDPYHRRIDSPHLTSETSKVAPPYSIDHLPQKGKAGWDSFRSRSLEDSRGACRFSSTAVRNVNEEASASEYLEHDNVRSMAFHRISPSHSVTSCSTVERITREIREPDSRTRLFTNHVLLDSSLSKTIARELRRRVHWQETDTFTFTIAEAVTRCKATGRCSWINLAGHDMVGKKLIASTLAEIIYGQHESLISVNLSLQEKDEPSELIVGCQESADYDKSMWGKTIVDQICAQVRKKPQSVLVLEGIDSADILVQNSLSQAVRSGKFPDSHGREVAINNAVVVTTTSICFGKQNSIMQNMNVNFTEDEVLTARKWQMKISVEQKAEDPKLQDKPNVRVSNLRHSAKRKRDPSAGRIFLDLNLSVAETEEGASEYQSDTVSENTEAWLEEFLSLIDVTVRMKPYDFDALADGILKKISAQFVAVFGILAALEISRDAVVQILAASWDSNEETALSEWMEMVLKEGFLESRRKYNHLGDRVLVTLASSSGNLMENQATQLCLPSKLKI